MSAISESWAPFSDTTSTVVRLIKQAAVRDKQTNNPTTNQYVLHPPGLEPLDLSCFYTTSTVVRLIKQAAVRDKQTNNLATNQYVLYSPGLGHWVYNEFQ
ncbi:hypothetical protein J6590_006144 [Homalodisca vitripennis]|nr:hypothetical protein J6590_006144 [Homalodisca vitripennis]